MNCQGRIDGSRAFAHADQTGSFFLSGWIESTAIIEHGEGYKEVGHKWVVDGCATQCGSRVIARTEGMKIQ